jgi:surface carbohydrate biosynthesis protein
LGNLKKALGTPKTFSRVPRKDLLVVSRERLVQVEGILPRDHYFVLDFPGDYLHANPRTLRILMSNLVRGIPPHEAYLLSVIDQADPKIVMTFTELYGGFHRLAARRPEKRFIGIQFAWRFPSGNEDLLELSGKRYLSEMLCFGENDIDGYAKLGIYFKSIVPCGSFLNSLYEARKLAAPPSSEHEFYDIGLVSQFRYLTGDGHVFTDSIHRFVQFVGRFHKDNPQYSIAIAGHYNPTLHPEAYSAEREYFEGPFGNSVAFTENNLEGYSTYNLLDRCAVTVSGGSTAAIESLGRANRTLICMPSAIPSMQPSKSIGWFLWGATYEEFSTRLCEILNMSDSDFRLKYRTEIDYFCGPEESQPAHEVLTEMIADVMNGTERNGTREHQRDS